MTGRSLFGEGLPFSLEQSEVLSPPARRVPRVAVFGDSFTDGRVLGAARHGWVHLVSDRLGVETVNMAVSGSGYVDIGGYVTFPYMATIAPVEDPDLVVVFGSVNDRPQDPFGVQLAAYVMYAMIRGWAGRSPLLVIGPPYPNSDVTEAMWALRDAVQAAALSVQATFVDPLQEGWFFGHPELIGPDGLHPNANGQAYLAGLIAPHIARLLDAGVCPASV